MKVYMSVDMEGCSGVTHLEHTSETGNDYQRARRLMTREANAAIDGALAVGATEIILNDGHGGNGNRNLVLEELHPAARLITGRPRPQAQMCTFDSTYAALMQVGYHTMAGAFGNISHTITGPVVADLRVNGRSVGEVGLNAYLAGEYGIPCVLVTGDQFMAKETHAFMPWAETAIVKNATGFHSAECLHPDVAAQTIREAASRALARLHVMKPLVAQTPVTIELKCHNPGIADSADGVSGVERIDPTTLRYTANRFSEGYEMVWTLIKLGMANALLPSRR